MLGYIGVYQQSWWAGYHAPTILDTSGFQSGYIWIYPGINLEDPRDHRPTAHVRLLFHRHPPKTESLELEDARIDFDQATRGIVSHVGDPRGIAMEVGFEWEISIYKWRIFPWCLMTGE